jgi:predicted GIY-YIG superfamily endonuclease
MTFWVYILRCADGSYYTGHTDNLEKRFDEHQAGACGGYTAERLPVELAWSQECASREEALAAEQQIKGWGRKKKEAMMRGDWSEVNRLGRGKHQHQRKPSASTPAASQPTLSTNGGDAVRPERSEAESKGKTNEITKEKSPCP